tara:strand:+ start:6904 stop:7317 length:414 start_codon:yes stop_codon:yes gene_type:complete
MFNFLKKNPATEKLKADDIKLYGLRLLIHMAIADGILDSSERKELARFINVNFDESEITFTLDEEISNVENSSSFFEEISKINSEFDEKAKINLLKEIWRVIIADCEINPYEENLFYRIGELIKVKRSKLNLIKSKA